MLFEISECRNWVWQLLNCSHLSQLVFFWWSQLLGIVDVCVCVRVIVCNSSIYDDSWCWIRHCPQFQIWVLHMLRLVNSNNDHSSPRARICYCVPKIYAYFWKIIFAIAIYLEFKSSIGVVIAPLRVCYNSQYSEYFVLRSDNHLCVIAVFDWW